MTKASARRKSGVLAGAAACCAAMSEIGLAQSGIFVITGVGNVGVPAALSADGRYFVGDGFLTTHPEAYRWSQATGVASLGAYMGSRFSQAWGLSATGTFACGQMWGSGFPMGAFLWSEATGKTHLGLLSGAPNCSARAVSANGQVVVGYCDPTGNRTPFIWTPAAGIQRPMIGATDVWLLGVSADGQTILGNASFTGLPPENDVRVFRASAQAGGVWSVEKLGPDHPDNRQSYFGGSSPDGDAVVGTFDTNGQNRNGYLWREGQGFFNIPRLPGFGEGYGTAVSGDGSLVGGYCYDGGVSFAAWFWSPAMGLKTAAAYLTEQGLTIPVGSGFTVVTSISSDGRTILLQGTIGGVSGPIIARLCYANCDASTSSPRLSANDFVCFLNRFAAGDYGANCDGSTGSPLLTGNDFMCFLNAYVAGCS
jgi:uncharacterized membrane protein